MNQPIPGVAPPQLGEVTIMSVWPSISALAGGRMWGQLYESNACRGLLPLGLTLGKLIAFCSIPLVLPAYFFLRIPGWGHPYFLFRPGGLLGRPRLFGLPVWGWNKQCVHYRLTNRRLIVESPLGGVIQRSVNLDDFDAIDVEIQPGQKWFNAGDLVFKRGQVETFRISGVQRPETFRQTCLKAHKGYVGSREAVTQQLAHA